MSRYQAAMETALPRDLHRLTGLIVGACIEVHRALGPGLLESVYDVCLAAELQHQGIGFVRQLALPVQYRDVMLEAGLRLDFLIEDRVVLELKAVEIVLPVHNAQVLSYLRLTNRPGGLLVNFCVPNLRGGVHRIINPGHADVKSVRTT